MKLLKDKFAIIEDLKVSLIIKVGSRGEVATGVHEVRQNVHPGLFQILTEGGQEVRS